MSKKLTKRQLRLQLTFVYTVMVFAVIAIVAVLILVIQGYRYNSYDGKLEQGGLVQFDSNPDGANVKVDDTMLANKTASKIVLTAGNHHIELTRDNYNSWSKDVIVKPGSVLWLNYPLLFPANPQVATVAKFDAATASVLPSPNQHTMAVINDAAVPTISLVTLNVATPTVSTVTLPATVYTPPTDGTTQSFQLVEWDKDSNLLLVKHKVNDTTEYLSVDTRDPARTIDISTALGVNVTSAMYARNDTSIVYVLTKAGDLRRVNTSSSTLSGPLAGNVSSFRVTESNVVIYETKADENGQRIVGYVSSDSTKAKVLSSYTDLGKGVLLATSGTYYGDHYVAILHGTTLDIMKGNLMSSNSNAVPALQHVAELEVSREARYIGFSPDDSRMIYVAGGKQAVVYDLELDTNATINLANALTSDLTWIDGYHIASTGGNGYYYDFDGTNGQLFAKESLNLPATLDSSAKYLYYFTNVGDATVLNRVKLQVS